MAGRLRSSRMSGLVLEEGLRKGVGEIKNEMKGLLWKIERSRDTSQEGLKSMVLKGFEAMGKVLENVMVKVGESMVEEVKRQDRGERELEERVCTLEERKVDNEQCSGSVNISFGSADPYI